MRSAGLVLKHVLVTYTQHQVDVVCVGLSILRLWVFHTSCLPAKNGSSQGFSADCQAQPRDVQIHVFGVSIHMFAKTGLDPCQGHEWVHCACSDRGPHAEGLSHGEVCVMGIANLEPPGMSQAPLRRHLDVVPFPHAGSCFPLLRPHQRALLRGTAPAPDRDSHRVRCNRQAACRWGKERASTWSRLILLVATRLLGKADDGLVQSALPEDERFA